MSEILVESDSSKSKVDVHRVEDPYKAEAMASITATDEQAVVDHTRMAELTYPYPESKESAQAAVDARQRADEKADRVSEVWDRTKTRLEKEATEPVSWASPTETEVTVEQPQAKPSLARRIASKALGR